MEQGETAATVAPVEQAAPATADSGNMWAIVGGTGAVLLLGGAAYALSRRRKIVSGEVVETSYEPQSARVADVPVGAAAGGLTPAATIDAPAKPLERQPVATVTPQFARSGATAPMVGGDLEAVAAAAPTADNPFLTRRNRLRRANFLLHREQSPNAAPQRETVNAPNVATANQAQSQRSAQPVYSFGKAPVTYRKAGWKPSTT